VTPNISPTQAAGSSDEGRGGLMEIVALPDPIVGSRLGLAFRLDGPFPRLRLRLYTRAMVQAWEGTVEGDFKAGWNRASVSLPDLASGAYVLWAQSDGRPRLLKVYLLR
jgi:hypothetical protein